MPASRGREHGALAPSYLNPGAKPAWGKVVRLQVSNNQTSHPVARIGAWALGVGFVSLAAGLLGMHYFAPSNLDALIGIFVTGPLGILAGALIGALSVAKDRRRLAIACVALVWVMALLYTFWAFALGGWAGIPALPVQLMVLASTAYLYVSGSAEPTGGRRQCDAIAAGAVAIILLMTLFPPVGLFPSAAQSGADALLPSFAFIFDSGFGPKHVPPFAVNRLELAAEWIITVVVAVGLCLLTRTLRARPAA
jgi:hypothetical protein